MEFLSFFISCLLWVKTTLGKESKTGTHVQLCLSITSEEPAVYTAASWTESIIHVPTSKAVPTVNTFNHKFLDIFVWKHFQKMIPSDEDVQKFSLTARINMNFSDTP